MKHTLIFVYNAESGAKNGLLDAAHKILRPSTYACQLCSLTHGPFFERSKWKRFRKKLMASGYALDFVYKDDFLKYHRSKFGHKFTFPIVLLDNAGSMEVVVNTSDLNAMQTAEALMASLEKTLALDA
ncbi:GTPase [Maribacter sp. 2307ULW6-5]